MDRLRGATLRDVAGAIARQPGYPGIVIQSFRDTGTAHLFDGENSKAARKLLPTELHRMAQRRLEQLDSAATIGDLRAPPANRLEALLGDRRGQHSIRINDQFRICFTWTEKGPAKVEVTDYH